MAVTVFSVAIALSMAIHATLGIYVQCRCESKKKITFLAMILPGFLLLLGFLLEINAGSIEAAFVSRKILYTGFSFTVSTLLIFVIDYCDMKIHNWFIALLIVISLFVTVLVWTNDVHHLFYKTVTLGTGAFLPYLAKTRGPLGIVGHIQALSCLAAAGIILTYKYLKANAESRTKIFLLMLALIITVIANIVYLINPFNLYINYGALAAFVFILLSAINILKNDMLDIEPIAKEKALDSIRDAFVLIDTNLAFISANESAKKIFSSLKTLRKNSPITRLNEWPDELSSIDEKNNSANFTMPGDFYYNASISPIIATQKMMGYIIIIKDMTESVTMEKKLEEMANEDMLTGIMNRRHFMNSVTAQFERIKRQNGNAYLIMFDLDHFKNVNDTYGHLAGDEVLKSVAERVKEVIRAYDLFGRYGGEEFIIFAEISSEEIEFFSERIRKSLNQSPIVFEGGQITITGSFGVAAITSGSLGNTIKQVDEALYQAKAAGRNKVVLFQ